MLVSPAGIALAIATKQVSGFETGDRFSRVVCHHDVELDKLLPRVVAGEDTDASGAPPPSRGGVPCANPRVGELGRYISCEEHGLMTGMSKPLGVGAVLLLCLLPCPLKAHTSITVV